jgi:hypothetical protein
MLHPSVEAAIGSAPFPKPSDHLLHDARPKIEAWRRDYDDFHPQGPYENMTPCESVRTKRPEGDLSKSQRLSLKEEWFVGSGLEI